MNSKLLSFLCFVIVGLTLTGCQSDLDQSVAQTDAAVYRIINQAWTADYGTQSNYRINDPNIPNTSTADIDPNVLDRLTLPEAVAIATIHNRDYATQKENLYLTALDQTDIQHLYEPIPLAGINTGYRRDGDADGLGAIGNAGFEQLLATGARIGTDISLGWVDILSGDFRSGFSSIATAVITQPLLRGAGRKVALENLTQAQRNTLYQVRAFNRYRKEFVTAVISEYYQLLQLNDEFDNARKHYLSLALMYEKLKKRATAGKLPLHELEQTDQDRMEAMSDYLQAQKDFENALDTFKRRLALIPSTPVQLDMNELIALRDSVIAKADISVSQAIELALNQRLDLANAADAVIDAERKVDVAADAIRAQLDLIGYINPATENKTVFGANPGQLERTRQRYELSMRLDLPVDRLTEKNNYRRALISLMQQQRAHQEMTDTVVLEIQTSHRRMVEARQRYLIQKKSARLAQKRADNTLLLLQYGRASTRDALDAREDLLDAENAATEALIDYAVASLEFFRDTEIMKIKPDGMWEKQLSINID